MDGVDPKSLFIIVGIIFIAVLIIVAREWRLHRRHKKDLAEAERRSNNVLIHDDVQHKRLMERVEQVKKEMGSRHCLDPSYKFIETHRLNAEK